MSMKTDIVIHPSTRERLNDLILNPFQALLISGPDGIGKTTVAKYYLSVLLQCSIDAIDNYKYGLIISPDKKSISIDQIRQLNEFLTLKTIGSDKIRRFVMIEHANLMTTAAQNSLLKNLEEPPSDTLIILTAGHRFSLIPPILSRVQSLEVYLPTRDMLSEHFQLDDDKFTKIYGLCAGLPGLMAAYVDDNNQKNNEPIIEAFSEARLLLNLSLFDRLCRVEKIAKANYPPYLLTDLLTRMATAALVQQSQKQNNTPSILKWQRVLKAGYTASNKLTAGSNVKLSLSELMLNL